MTKCARIIFPLIFILLNKGYTQDKAPVDFGKVTAEDFAVNSSLVNENTNAVIIAEVGNVKFEGNSSGWFTYIYKVQRRIKILNRKAFDLADVKIYLYSNNETEEKADRITASSYILENGKVVETKLSSNEVYQEKEDKNHFTKKFTVPGVREGTIIEYSYVVRSDFEFNLPEWEFQSMETPTLWSEYNVTIPALLGYMTVLQGYHHFFINENKEGHENYLITQKSRISAVSNIEQSSSLSATTVKQRWVMKDIPALNVENYVFYQQDFIDKISFQLYKTYDGQEYHDVINTWGKAVQELNKREDFGLPLQGENRWVMQLLKTIVNDTDSKLDAAKKIYNYIQRNYTCTDRYNKYIKTSLKDVTDKKSGTVGDINLLLTALLKQQSVDAVPVLLSTRDFGANSPTYPILAKLNYVICRAHIGDTDYYLDATQPFLAFGKLPLDCYNGHARVIAADTTAVYFSPDSIKENTFTNVLISNMGGGKIKGTFKQELGFFESLKTRNKIAGSGLNGYLTALKTAYPEEVLVGDIKADSVLSSEDPVSIDFDFTLKLFENADIVYFNPLLGQGLKINPFYAAERIYPVEMPYKTDETFVFTMEVPEGYAVEELPKSTKVKLNEEDGFFEYIVQNNNGIIQMRCRTVIKRTFFTSEDYKTLRDFYSYVVKKEAEQVVFKKIK